MDHVCIPKPREVLSVDDFLDSLDKTNSMFQMVARALLFPNNQIRCIYKKDSQLCEMVMGRKSVSRLPVIDKPLQVVIEAGDFHETITAALYSYHFTSRGFDLDVRNSFSWWELYCHAGYGYYFTGAYGNDRSVIISEQHYKPDSFDKDLLIRLGFSF
ncbi:MAG: hypothetical protein LiPW30_251 [Parcubacteria group bacterium LiPW_30]|nr:MAG: hypothetical protein LiPW30_251 [Parcubacteria group bacterium LiPW_30]